MICFLFAFVLEQSNRERIPSDVDQSSNLHNPQRQVRLSDKVGRSLVPTGESILISDGESAIQYST